MWVEGKKGKTSHTLAPRRIPPLLGNTSTPSQPYAADLVAHARLCQLAPDFFLGRRLPHFVPATCMPRLQWELVSVLPSPSVFLGLGSSPLPSLGLPLCMGWPLDPAAGQDRSAQGDTLSIHRRVPATYLQYTLQAVSSPSAAKIAPVGGLPKCHIRCGGGTVAYRSGSLHPPSEHRVACSL
ncbi:hypothetical protein GQ53DRAFT_744495 [Thozetella sp. PMI_491]|nr:hypothetical protein GQ53DRAFT_744495 [Thozetella sp. PMI_491]